MIDWGNPAALWGLCAVPLLAAALAAHLGRARRAVEAIAHPDRVPWLRSRVGAGRRGARAAATVMAVALALAALARPRVEGGSAPARKRGLDLAIALDFSRSMLAADVAPTRLDHARLELSRLLDRLPGDRVGLVAFAGEAVAYPLTDDHDAARLFWRDLQPADMPVGGSALDGALRAALDVLEGAGETDAARAVVLISDGEETAGGDPLAAAREAAKDGVRIFTVGVGSEAGELVPEGEGGGTGWKRGPDGSYVASRLDEALLRRVAEVTGGRYLRAGGTRPAFEQVAEALDGLKRSERAGRVAAEYHELYAVLLLPAFLLLLLERCMGDRRGG